MTPRPPPPRSARSPSPAARGRTNAAPPNPRLYLMTPLLGDVAAFARQLPAVLAAGDVAAVLVRLEDSDERTRINRAKALAAIVQVRDIALLLDGEADIVARAGADGAHLTGIAALNAALGALKPERIAGAGGLRSRHDAMLAAEAGADYVMFGEADRAGRRPAFDLVAERVKWWAELFESPCVGYAENLDEVGALAQAGADFVALSKVDAVDDETLKRQAERLKRAMRTYGPRVANREKRARLLLLSSVIRRGVVDVLRAAMAAIEAGRAEKKARTESEAAILPRAAGEGDHAQHGGGGELDP